MTLHSQELVVEYACAKAGAILSTSTPRSDVDKTPPPFESNLELLVAPRRSVTIGSDNTGNPTLVADSSTTLFRCQWEGQPCDANGNPGSPNATKPHTGYPDHLEKFLTESAKYDVDQLYYGSSCCMRRFLLRLHGPNVNCNQPDLPITINQAKTTLPGVQ